LRWINPAGEIPSIPPPASYSNRNPAGPVRRGCGKAGATRRRASVPRSCGRCRGCHSPGFSFGFCGRGNLGPAFGSPVFCSARFVPPEQPRGPPLFRPSLDVQRDGRHHTTPPRAPGSFLNADLAALERRNGDAVGPPRQRHFCKTRGALSSFRLPHDWRP
jgi:hypothetical protein